MAIRIVQSRVNWGHYLTQGNLNGIMTCYSKSPIFKGTFSNNITYNTKSLQDYFVNLIKQNPKVVFKETKIIQTGELYFDSGKYKFILDNKTINANYQFVYQEIDQEFKIISHLSLPI